ncbi:MAG: M1 family metallopeptidase [Candidatus Marsarchaeota archaeon]|nr:M1 family metallopeptidase [Candidatus Marsarchaeota archaeon]
MYNSSNVAPSATRVGNNVVPINYKLFFDTDFDSFKFKGKAEIQLKISEKCREFKINANQLDIMSVKLISGSIEQACRIKLDKKNKIATISFKTGVSGEAKLEIKFIGINNDAMYGFYRSSYKGLRGNTEYLLSSQFEAADARAAFPCFDEPEFKATFDVSIAIPRDMTALSNMPIKREEPSGKRKVVTFQTTPRMSTYLLYLGVGHFESISGNLGKLKINVYATPGKKKLCPMALNYAKKFIAFYEKYFGIKYPLPKVDLIAIPDFAAGAMENWGSITFREVALLGDEKHSSIGTKQQIAETVAHELAHQWFGDLVTMKWWNDLWLNESFATFMSFKAMEAVFPEWDVEKKYFDEVIATAFTADALKNTHPISVNVSTPEEINEIFDEISYEKGGTFLHMLEDFATPEVFRKGLHAYLEAHAYSNATKFDLWNAISDTAKKLRTGNASHIREFADYWLDKPGYPILKTAASHEALHIRQSRFMLSNMSNNIKSKWPIKIKYIEEGKNEKSIFMDSGTAELKASQKGYVKLNYGQDYLYRVAYDMPMLKKLCEAVRSRSMLGTDAWGIENDLFVMARTGQIRAVSYLEFVEEYFIGVGYPANSNIISHLGWLEAMLYDTFLYPDLVRVSTKFSSDIVERFGWSKKQNEDPTTTMLRSSALQALGRLGYKKVEQKMVAEMAKYLKTGKKPDPDMRSPIYYTSAWYGSSYLFGKILQLYKNESNPEEKRRLLQSLAFFRSKNEINEALRLSLSSPDIRLQDAFVIPAIMMSNPEAMQHVFKWTYAEWKTLMKKYDIGTHMLERYVDNFSVAYTANDYKRFKSFFASPSNARQDIKKTLAKTSERIGVNIKFRKANGLDA